MIFFEIPIILILFVLLGLFGMNLGPLLQGIFTIVCAVILCIIILCAILNCGASEYEKTNLKPWLIAFIISFVLALFFGEQDMSLFSLFFG